MTLRRPKQRVEFFRQGANPVPGAGTGEIAKQLEDAGWDGLAVGEAHGILPDPYAVLAVAAAATTRLKVATAVAIPIRHPMLAADAMATVQGLSNGRAVFGIGRGDGGVKVLQQAPMRVADFEVYISRIQGYLRREIVDIEGNVSAMGRLYDIDPSLDVPKPPLDVAATGPKVIALGATLAERVTFAVGADEGRVRWAVECAKSARRDAGLDADGVTLGAYLPVFAHPDRAAARQLVSGGVASYARFSVMHGSVVGPADEARRGTLTAVHDAYDMDRHFTHGSPQSAPLTDEVIDAFGVAGPPSYCVDRILALRELGLSKVFVMPGGVGVDREEAAASHRRIVEEVLPALRGSAHA